MFDGVALVAAVALAVGRERKASKGGGKRGRGGAEPEPDATANEVLERLDGLGVDEPSPNQFGPPGKDVA
jgi:hypothetical protein